MSGLLAHGYLCNMFNVSRATVRTAVLELARQGYLKRQQGKGTFIYKKVISEGLNMQINLREIFLEDYDALTSHTIAKTVMVPVNNLNAKLEVPSDKHIIYIKRLWSFQNEPILLQEVYIPYHICPLLLEDNIEQHSLLVIFEKKYGIKITRVKNYIELHCVKTDEAHLLQMPEGSYASQLTQQFYSGDTIIIYAESVKQLDKFKFFLELERKIA